MKKLLTLAVMLAVLGDPAGAAAIKTPDPTQNRTKLASSQGAIKQMGGYTNDLDKGSLSDTSVVDSICGYYVVGDYNGSGSVNVADVVDMWSKLRTGNPTYRELLCECPLGTITWPVRGDVNNSCDMNIADVILMIIRPPQSWLPCHECPPGSPAPRSGIKPLITPDLKSKVKP